MSVGAPEILERTGITYRQLDHWTRIGYLRPDNGSPGSGNSRRYPATEADVADLMARLVGIGMAPKQAHTIARKMSKLPPDGKRQARIKDAKVIITFDGKDTA